MVIAALRSHDCLTGSYLSKNLSSSSTQVSPNQKSALIVKVTAKKLVMEHITILKRGEDLNPEFKIEIKTAPKEKKKKKVTIRDDQHPRSGKENENVKNTDEESKLFSADRFGPEPDKVPKQIHLTNLKSVGGVVEKFVGSAAITTPSPSSLPLPSFFAKKKDVVSVSVSVSVSSSSSDKAASEYLKSMLGLNLV